MILKGTVIFIFLFSTFGVAQSNQFIVDSIYNTKLNNAEKLHQLIFQLNKYDTVNPSENVGYLYHKIGLLYYKEKKYKQAITFTKKAVLHRSLIKSIDTLKLHRSLYNISMYYKKLHLLDSCKVYLTKITNNQNADKYTINAYYGLSDMATDNGDFFMAFNYLKKLFSLINPNDNNALIKYHQTCIYIYTEMGDFASNNMAILYHKKEVEKLIPKKIDNNFASMYNNIANYYDGIGKSDEAILYYKKALKYYLNKKDTTQVGNIYNNIGATFAANKAFKKASFFFNKGIQATNDKTVLARIYDNQGYYLQTKNAIDKTVFYKKAIQCFTKKDAFHISNASELIALKNPSDKKDVLGYLLDLTNSWVTIYEENGNTDFLIKAKKGILIIDKLVSSIRLKSAAEKSKLFWIKKGVNTYMLGVKICYLLNDIGTAFYFMEKNKSLLLLENISASTITKSKSLQIASFKKSVKKWITPSACFVEFILNKKDGYGIFCSNEKKFFYRIKNIDMLLKNVQSLKLSCTKPFNSRIDFTSYATTSKQVFNTLFPFKNAFDLISNKKLFIIPDFKLQNLAFETLVPNTNTVDNYLIYHTEISYLQSISVLNQILNKKRNTTKDLLNIAPINFQDSTLISIPQTKKNALPNPFSITSLHYAKANKNAFINAINKYKIIHINTHAGIDTKNNKPWIAFWDKKLFLQELDKIPNQADLIILDACNSASGNLAVGEGILSLSRGFFLTGTKSVIASLWNANLNSTNLILASFYSELSKNNSKSKALHHAKLHYLKNAQLSEKSPYYWASMILTGDSDTIRFQKRTSPFYFLFLLLFPIGYLLLKK